MGKTISIGAQSFEFIRKNDYFFVDKTGFIKEWWENGDVVTLINRPRRFGKTLNLDMLECFFSKKYEDRGDLFEGLSIWEDEKYRKLQGSYPVIFLSFANIKGATFEKTLEGIKYTLVKLYETHEYVKNGKDMGKRELEFFDSVSADMPDTVAELALQYLSDYLSRYYGRKTLIFLDEYDTPLQEAYVQGYWPEMVQFIRSMFNAAFKTNPYMERAIMTGITRVSRESIFSDLNNLTVVTTTSKKYQTQFGFTEKEVFQALDLFGLSEQRGEVKRWYDGFTFGSQKDIYNPWSIINLLDERKFKSYWANSSSNALVGKLIREGSAEVKMDMEALLDHKIIEKAIDEEIVFNQLDEDETAIWSLLLASGYLKVEYPPEDEWGIYGLSLTNYEVARMFRRMIQGWFKNPSVKYNDFVKALLLNDVEYMNDYMNQVSEQIFSFFDTGKGPSQKSSPERFYHGFVLGLIVELAGRYKVSSNRESGFGRYDVMLEPLDLTKPAYVLEFKVRNPRREETLEETLAAARKQMEEKQYDQELLGRGIPREQIYHYGFAFEGKRVLIG